MRNRSTVLVLNIMILSVTVEVGTIWSGMALASDKCLTEPDPQPRQGNHWYYYIDRESHRKCWYVGRARAKAPQTVTSRSSLKPKSDARIARNMDADNEVSHHLDEAARETLFQEFLRWQERQNPSQSPSDKADQDTLFREFVLWQARQARPDR